MRVTLLAFLFIAGCSVWPDTVEKCREYYYPDDYATYGKCIEAVREQEAKKRKPQKWKLSW